jgi:superfamily II DNA/RNA helicase
LEVRFKGLDNDPTEDVLKFLKKVYSNRQKRLQEAKSEDEPSAKERIKGICGIIYCSTREKCESVTKTLKAHSINAATYHAGLKQSERQKILNNWSKTTSETPQVQSSRPSVTQASLAFQPASSLTQAKSQSSAFQPASTLTKTKQYITKNHPLTIPPVDDEVIDIVVATISFGMGIDKKQVRFIIHWELPQSLEGYYQESGRAGRDGKTSRCILYYSKPDVDRILYLQSLNQKEQKMSKEKKSFEKLVEYCETTSICRHQFITQYFTSKSTQPCKENCDICKEQAKVKKRKNEYDYNVRNNTQYGENTFTKLEEFGSMGYMSAKNRQGDVRLKDGSLVTFGSTKREYDEFLQGDEEENYGFQKAGDVYNREYLFGRKDKDKPKTSLIEKFTYPLFNQKRVVQGLGASKREKIYLKIKDIVETKIIHEIDGNVQKDLAIEFEGQLFMASGLLVVYDTKSNSFLRKIMALEPAPINELAEIIKKLFQ